MGRFARSGVCDEAIVVGTTDVRELLGEEITPNRVFWLETAWIYNSHATQDCVVQLYDEDENATGTPTAAAQRASFPCPAAITTLFEPAKPILFRTNVCACLAAAVGTCAAYQCGCSGYEDGGT